MQTFATWSDTNEPDVSQQVRPIAEDLFKLEDKLFHGQPAPGKTVPCDVCGGHGGKADVICNACEGEGTVFVPTGEPTPGLIPALQAEVAALKAELAELRATVAHLTLHANIF